MHTKRVWTVLLAGVAAAAPWLPAAGDAVEAPTAAEEARLREEYRAYAELPAVQESECRIAVLEVANGPRDAGGAAVEAAEHAMAGYYDALQARLAASEDPVERMMALRLRDMPGRTSSSDDPARSTAIAAEVDVAWTDPVALTHALLMLMASMDDTLQERIGARIRELDPENLVGLLAGLERAASPAAETALLQAVRAGGRMPVHSRSLLRHYVRALAAEPLPPEMRAALETDPNLAPFADIVTPIALWAAHMLPSYQALTRACSKHAVAQDLARAAPCEAIGEALATSGETLIDEFAGMRILLDLAADPDAVRARRRLAEWRMEQFQTLSATGPRRTAALTALQGDSAYDDRTESELMAILLEQAGMAVTPPADWVSPREQREMAP
ncbi:hypothetical protein [Coralloluteibacterium stylophorae]|uniref:Secreted protein n=2 Tax=Coralloluteibacterium stylophorae TaxID=1776034 RepID=A0A8J7VQH5_9GAMM|nr:hypothetical protein [Coralloluteibacterium stylophorae]MBS7457338.1 hypothetical protein [Coralloluteibacterium stylophorae]